MSFNLDKIEVGTEVVLSRFGTWDTHYYFNWKVVAVSPTKSRITVQQTIDGGEGRPVVFNAKGKSTDKGGYKDYELHTDTAVQRAKERVRVLRATMAHQANNLGSDVRVGSRPSSEDVSVALAKVEARGIELRKMIDAVAQAEKELFEAIRNG
jgi:hypothetical protein